MLFNSLFFIFIFFPCVLLVWYGLQRLKSDIPAKVFLLGMSLWFYGYYNISYLWVLLVSIGVNFLLYRLMVKTRKNASVSLAGERMDSNINGGKQGALRLLFLLGLVLNLGFLFYLKYFNFFIDNCNLLLHTSISIEKIALPLGISFFTFQQISFLADCVEDVSFLDYACYISYFPQLVAGPIVLNEEFLPQLKRRAFHDFSPEGFFYGLERFALGLSKKVLLADTLALFVDGEYSNLPALDGITAWVTIIFYMLQLYFDFSGYSDMAIGLGAMMGFELPENFESPLRSVSVRDFWRRWHITLGRFFTRYVYIPLGGNRKGLARQCLNLFIVFMLSGIWHGANWTFVVWGFMHTVAVVAEAFLQGMRRNKKREADQETNRDLQARDASYPQAKEKYLSNRIGKWCKQVVTFVYVTLSFSIFRASSMEDAILLWKKLFTGGYNGLIIGASNLFVLKETFVLRQACKMLWPIGELYVFLFTMVLLLVLSWVLITGRRGKVWIQENGRTRLGILVVAILFVWSVLSLSGVSTFLYFNF